MEDTACGIHSINTMYLLGESSGQQTVSQFYDYEETFENEWVEASKSSKMLLF